MEIDRRQKLVPALEQCSRQWKRTGTCIGCPYNKQVVPPCYAQLLDDAAEAIIEQDKLLHEQECAGVKPKKSDRKLSEAASSLGLFCPDFWCGSCGFSLVGHPNFCQNCGKKVDWND